MLEALKLFLENLNVDCTLITHHTSAIAPAADLSGPHFLERKQEILRILDDEPAHGDFGRNAAIRSRKTTLYGRDAVHWAALPCLTGLCYNEVKFWGRTVVLSC
ncbi:MAG: hypothetical protein HDQ87_05770 [Clostridia bacterium]|nr:hypothetical protein [Clostridia bacterium]